jgi:SecD/SecF fusion protein
VLFKPVQIPNGKKKPTTAFVRAVGPVATLHRAENGNAGLLDGYGGKVPKGWKVLPVPHETVLITCSAKTTTICPGDPAGLPPTGHTDYYLFKKGAYPNDRYATDGKYPNMKGTELKLSGTRADIDQAQGPVVLMQFTKKGNKAFEHVTKNEAIRGQIQQSEQHFAIVLDNEIRSWPQINYKDLPNGINPAGTGAQITGMASLQEAKDLALVLQTGALPVNFIPLERTDVSATLGKDSLKQARNAAIGGLILVAVFLLLLYRFLGLVAVIGLAIYGAFMYAAIVLLGVTLTLPGFAGLILTIGVAADANVVVFERIKEESRAGKSVRAAIAAGYAKGFRTILDANVVTAITALILFAVATAGVKGFALMLLIGTVISLITAVAATRAMLGLLAGFSWFQNPRFMGASTR